MCEAPQDAGICEVALSLSGLANLGALYNSGRKKTPYHAAENVVSCVLSYGIVQLLQQQLEGRPHENVIPCSSQRVYAFTDSARSL
jgi:hypothetical protein